MKRILLVDDNEGFRRPLAAILQRAGYEVQTAGDGAAALALFRQHRFDLVITDLIMPEKEGLETIMELRRLRPTLKIIAMSGGGRMDPSDYLPMAERLGAALTLTKPFSAQEFLEAVATLLREPEGTPPSPA
jgi:DNA-binding response OmpR family regulator